jgi:hypothetical protein
MVWIQAIVCRLALYFDTLARQCSTETFAFATCAHYKSNRFVY